MSGHKKNCFYLRATALCICLIFSINSSVYSAPLQSAGPTAAEIYRLTLNAGLALPSEYGRVEKYHQGTSDKTIIYIKDAHDSLDAQENIAHIIHYLVDRKGVRTVYEEGYEGSVPSDKYFGFLEERDVKERVSYYLMDRLKIGGAEYAHINRTKDFRLIGADSQQLHFENIHWYQQNSEIASETDRDLKRIYKELKRLAGRYLPAEVKQWLKYKNRFDRQLMDLTDYLKRTFELLGLPAAQIMRPAAGDYRRAYPEIFRLLEADMSKDEAAVKSAAEINLKDLYREMEHLESEISARFLKGKLENDILRYYRGIYLIYKLNRMNVTPQEFDSVKTYLQGITTRDIALFIAENSKRSVALSRFWEKNIETALRFYQTAEKRDRVIESHLDDYLGSSDENEAVVVYGGFHQDGLESIFQEKGLSYYVVSPVIKAISPDHQQLYRKKMAEGERSIRIPDDEARLISDFQKAELDPAGAEAFRHEIRLLADVVQELGVDQGSHAAALTAIRQKLKKHTLPRPVTTHSELRAVESKTSKTERQRSWREADPESERKRRQEQSRHYTESLFYGISVTTAAWLIANVWLLDFRPASIEAAWMALSIFTNAVSFSLYTTVKNIRKLTVEINQNKRRKALYEADVKAKRIAYDLRLPGHVETPGLNASQRQTVLDILSRLSDRDDAGHLQPFFVVSRENKVTLRIMRSRKKQNRAGLRIENRTKKDKTITVLVDPESEETIASDLAKGLSALGESMKKYQSDDFYLLQEEKFMEFQKRRELLGEFINDEFFVARDSFLRFWNLVNISLQMRAFHPDLPYSSPPILEPATVFDFNRVFQMDTYDLAVAFYDKSVMDANINAARFADEAKAILEGLFDPQKLDPSIYNQYLRPLYDWMKSSRRQFDEAMKTWYGPGHVIVLSDKEYSEALTTEQILHERLHTSIEGKRETALRNRAYAVFISDDDRYQLMMEALQGFAYQMEAVNKKITFSSEFWVQLMHPSLPEDKVKALWQAAEKLAETDRDVRSMISLLKRLDEQNRVYLAGDLRRLGEYRQYRKNRSETRKDDKKAKKEKERKDKRRKMRLSGAHGSTRRSNREKPGREKIPDAMMPAASLDEPSFSDIPSTPETWSGVFRDIQSSAAADLQRASTERASLKIWYDFQGSMHAALNQLYANVPDDALYIEIIRAINQDWNQHVDIDRFGSFLVHLIMSRKIFMDIDEYKESQERIFRTIASVSDEEGQLWAWWFYLISSTYHLRYFGLHVEAIEGRIEPVSIDQDIILEIFNQHFVPLYLKWRQLNKPEITQAGTEAYRKNRDFLWMIGSVFDYRIYDSEGFNISWARSNVFAERNGKPAYTRHPESLYPEGPSQSMEKYITPMLTAFPEEIRGILNEVIEMRRNDLQQDEPEYEWEGVAVRMMMVMPRILSTGEGFRAIRGLSAQDLTEYYDKISKPSHDTFSIEQYKVNPYDALQRLLDSSVPLNQVAERLAVFTAPPYLITAAEIQLQLTAYWGILFDKNLAPRAVDVDREQIIYGASEKGQQALQAIARLSNFVGNEFQKNPLNIEERPLAAWDDFRQGQILKHYGLTAPHDQDQMATLFILGKIPDNNRRKFGLLVVRDDGTVGILSEAGLKSRSDQYRMLELDTPRDQIIHWPGGVDGKSMPHMVLGEATQRAEKGIFSLNSRSAAILEPAGLKAVGIKTVSVLGQKGTVDEMAPTLRAVIDQIEQGLDEDLYEIEMDRSDKHVTIRLKSELRSQLNGNPNSEEFIDQKIEYYRHELDHNAKAAISAKLTAMLPFHSMGLTEALLIAGLGLGGAVSLGFIGLFIGVFLALHISLITMTKQHSEQARRLARLTEDFMNSDESVIYRTSRPWIENARYRFNWLKPAAPDQTILLRSLLNYYFGFINLTDDEARNSDEKWVQQAYADTILEILMDEELITSGRQESVFKKLVRSKNRAVIRIMDIDFGSLGQFFSFSPKVDDNTEVPYEELIRTLRVIEEVIPGLKSEQRSEARKSSLFTRRFDTMFPADNRSVMDQLNGDSDDLYIDDDLFLLFDGIQKNNRGEFLRILRSISEKFKFNKPVPESFEDFTGIIQSAEPMADALREQVTQKIKSISSAQNVKRKMLRDLYDSANAYAKTLLILQEFYLREGSEESMHKLVFNQQHLFTLLGPFRGYLGDLDEDSPLKERAYARYALNDAYQQLAWWGHSRLVIKMAVNDPYMRKIFAFKMAVPYGALIRRYFYPSAREEIEEAILLIRAALSAASQTTVEERQKVYGEEWKDGYYEDLIQLMTDYARFLAISETDENLRLALATVESIKEMVNKPLSYLPLEADFKRVLARMIRPAHEAEAVQLLQEAHEAMLVYANDYMDSDYSEKFKSYWLRHEEAIQAGDAEDFQRELKLLEDLNADLDAEDDDDIQSLRPLAASDLAFAMERTGEHDGALFWMRVAFQDIAHLRRKGEVNDGLADFYESASPERLQILRALAAEILADPAQWPDDKDAMKELAGMVLFAQNRTAGDLLYQIAGGIDAYLESGKSIKGMGEHLLAILGPFYRVNGKQARITSFHLQESLKALEPEIRKRLAVQMREQAERRVSGAGPFQQYYMNGYGFIANEEFDRQYEMFDDLLDAHFVLNGYDLEKTMQLTADFYQAVNAEFFGIQSASANYFMAFVYILQHYHGKPNVQNSRYEEQVRNFLDSFDDKYADVLSLKEAGVDINVRIFIWGLLVNLAKLFNDEEMQLKYLQKIVHDFKSGYMVLTRERQGPVRLKEPVEPRQRFEYYRDVLPVALKAFSTYSDKLRQSGNNQAAQTAFDLWTAIMSGSIDYLNTAESSNPESPFHSGIKTLTAEAAAAAISEINYADQIRMTAPNSPLRTISEQFLAVMMTESMKKQNYHADRYRVLTELAWLLGDDQALKAAAEHLMANLPVPGKDETVYEPSLAITGYLQTHEMLNQLFYAVKHGQDVGVSAEVLQGEIDKIRAARDRLSKERNLKTELSIRYFSVETYYEIVKGKGVEVLPIIEKSLPKTETVPGYHLMLQLYAALIEEQNGHHAEALQILHQALIVDPPLQRGSFQGPDLEAKRNTAAAYLATIFPMPWRHMMAQLIMEKIFEEPVASEELSAALQIALFFHPETVEEIIVVHLEDISSRIDSFQTGRDLQFIESIVEDMHDRESRRRLYAVIDVLKAELPLLKKRFGNFQKILTELFTAEDYLDIAQHEYHAGQYEAALRAVKTGLHQGSGKTEDEVSYRLKALQDEILTVKAFADQARQAYESGDLETAGQAVSDVLELNPADSQMLRMRSNIEMLQTVRLFLSEGEWIGSKTEENGSWIGARAELEMFAKTHQLESDSQIRSHIDALRRFEAGLELAAFLLVQNRYQQAEHSLNGLISDLQILMRGAPIYSDQAEIAQLRRGINEKRAATSKLQESLKDRSISVQQIYKAAFALAAYPEHRRETFDLLLKQGFTIFNQAADQNLQTARRDYQRSFQIGRVVLEVASQYEPLFKAAVTSKKPGKQLKNGGAAKEPEIETEHLHKARILISQSAANIWLPELKDDYFIVKGMDELAKEREKLQRQKLGLDPNAPIEFRFQALEMKTRSFVVSGFSADMLNSVRTGDNFLVSHIAENTLVPSAFKVIKRGTDFVELALPEIPESYEYIRNELERLFLSGIQAGGEEIGTIHHVRDSTWETQLAKTEHLVTALNETTVQAIDPENLPSMATVGIGFQAIDDMLGLRVKAPKFMQDKEKESADKRAERQRIAAWILEKEANEQIWLDPEQKEALIEAATTGQTYALFQGPPGTGKTTAIIWLVQILSGMANGRKPHVRVVAQQNEALDNIGRRILAKDIPFARVGNADQKVAEEIVPLWLAKQELLENMSQGKLTGEGSLILGTGIGIFTDRDLRSMVTLQDADVVILDEASRATAFEALTAVGGFTGVAKIFLVGDHFQLPAYGISAEDARQAIEELGRAGMLSIKDTPFGDRSVSVIFSKAKQERFRVSLFEKVHQLFEAEGGDFFQQTRPAFHFFNKQRRSGRKIVEISNFHYRDEQGNGLLEAKRDSDGIVEWIDTRRQSPEKHDANKSSYNPGEVIEVIAKIGELLNSPKYRNRETGFENMTADNIAVLSYYNKQVDEVLSAVTDFSKIHEFVARIIDADEVNDHIGPEEILAILDRTDFTDSADYLTLWLMRVAQFVLPFEDAAYEKAPSGQQRMAEERYTARAKHLLRKLAEEPDPEKADEVMTLLGLPYEFIPLEDIDEGRFKVLTVDSSIGNEYQAVILSMVRSNPTGSVGFLGNPLDGDNRINVSTSRAEDFLFIIGDKDTFRNASFKRTPIPMVRKWMAHVEKVLGSKSELRTDQIIDDESQTAHAYETPDIPALNVERYGAYSALKDELENLNVPVMMYVAYDDLLERFTDEQREELFGMAYQNAEKVRIVIYATKDPLHDKLKPFRQLRDESHNVWITKTEALQAFKNTQRDFIKDFDGAVSLHLSKESRNLRGEFQGVPAGELRFLRYGEEDPKGGLAAAALLYALGASAARFLNDFESDPFGILTIRTELRELIAQYEANIVVVTAA